MLENILHQYGIEADGISITPFGSGLINTTWKVTAGEKAYILQKINGQVFDHPQAIADNIESVAAYLRLYAPDYLFVSPVLSSSGSLMVMDGDKNYFRLLPFVADSFSKDVVQSPKQAYEAAAQFGRFTQLLSGFDTAQLQITIPAFHDLSLRYQQFLDAIENGHPLRIERAKDMVAQLKHWDYLVDQFNALRGNPAFKQRVTHHDTKISNVLFDSADKGICVIDLDTIMPGYFISDVGDMMRTYLSAVSEEERGLSLISIREDIYEAVVRGYFTEMKNELTDTEKQQFFYAGCYMIYMQAIRFLGDYFNEDQYYGARYADHNLDRASNQVVLLQKMMEKKSVLENVVLKVIAEQVV